MVNLVDVDNDKVIDSEDLELTEKFLELELREKKARTQEKMAWTALISMIVLVLFLISPIISVEKASVLSELFSMYFISVATILGAFFGVSAWMSNNALNNSNHETVVMNRNGKYSGSKRIPRSE